MMRIDDPITERDQPAEFEEWEDAMVRACFGTVNDHAESLAAAGVKVDPYLLHVIQGAVDPIVDFFRGERGVRDTETALVEDLVGFFTASLCKEPLTVKALRAVWLEYSHGDDPPVADRILAKKLDEAMETLKPYAISRSPWLAADMEY